MITEYIASDGTAYFAFATNDPADGAADDADSTPSAFVREVGASASGAPITTGVTVSLLSNASYPLGCYEVAVAASTASLTSGSKYTVYVSATVNGTTSVGAVGQIVVNELLTAKDVGLLLESGITTVNSQTDLDLTESFSVNDLYNGAHALIEDVSNGDTCIRRITDSAATNNNITIDSAPPFTVTTSDKVRIIGAYHPTAALGDYDPPTRTEATTDKNAVIAEVQGYARVLGRSDAANATDEAARISVLNQDGGSGSGDYDPTTDSLEVLADTQGSDSTNVSAIKAKTDSLTFSVAGVVDSNLKRVADSDNFTQNGTGGKKYGPSS